MARCHGGHYECPYLIPYLRDCKCSIRQVDPDLFNRPKGKSTHIQLPEHLRNRDDISVEIRREKRKGNVCVFPWGKLTEENEQTEDKRPVVYVDEADCIETEIKFRDCPKCSGSIMEGSTNCVHCEWLVKLGRRSCPHCRLDLGMKEDPCPLCRRKSRGAKSHNPVERMKRAYLRRFRRARIG